MAIYNGTQKINMSGIDKVYVGNTLVYQKLQAKVLTSITLSGQTTSFNVGDTFSFGGTVTAHYSDNTTANVTANTTFSGYNMSTGGTQTVTATYTEDGVTATATYDISVKYSTYTLKYFYNGSGNGEGRIRIRYHNANGSWVWGGTTTKTNYQSNTITVTAAKNTSIQVQVYNDTSYSNSFEIKQIKNNSTTKLTTLSVSSKSNKTWTSGNLNPGNNNTLTIYAEY